MNTPLTNEAGRRLRPPHFLFFWSSERAGCALFSTATQLDRLHKNTVVQCSMIRSEIEKRVRAAIVISHDRIDCSSQSVPNLTKSFVHAWSS